MGLYHANWCQLHILYPPSIRQWRRIRHVFDFGAYSRAPSPDTTSVPGPSRWDGDEDPGKIRFIVPKLWGKKRMRSATQPYCNNGWIRLCLTAHAISFPKFWNDKMYFTRVFVTVSPRRPWDRGCSRYIRYSSVIETNFFAPFVNFGSLVANAIIEIFLNFIELILVRVFLDGYLRIIGRKRVSRGSKWYEYCHGYEQCFAHRYSRSRLLTRTIITIAEAWPIW